MVKETYVSRVYKASELQLRVSQQYIGVYTAKYKYIRIGTYMYIYIYMYIYVYLKTYNKNMTHPIKVVERDGDVTRRKLGKGRRDEIPITYAKIYKNDCKRS